MGLFNLFKGQFIDVIEWDDEDPAILVHRFDRHNHEIKIKAKLIVRPGQTAVFVSEGRIADHFGPGTHTLETRNIPILTSILSLPYNFESPFKAEVYFIRRTDQLDRKWGTPTPVMMRDADFGIVRLRARGNYSYRVGTKNDLISRFVGARSEFRAADLEEQIKVKVISSLSDALGERKIPALDLASMYHEIGDAVRGHLAADFEALGLELIAFTVENISLPDEVNAAMDKRAGLGALSGVMNAYTQMQAADAMRAAADNPGGAGNMMGMMMGAQLAGAVGGVVGGTAAVPPPVPAAGYFVAVDGRQSGPFDIEQLKAQAAAGALLRSTLVWRQGMSGWQEAGVVPELSPVFAAAPPPLP